MRMLTGVLTLAGTLVAARGRLDTAIGRQMPAGRLPGCCESGERRVRGVLVDAGPLVAIIDADDGFHSACVEALKGLRDPLFTVWPALTEAMYLVGPLCGSLCENVVAA